MPRYFPIRRRTSAERRSYAHDFDTARHEERVGAARSNPTTSAPATPATQTNPATSAPVEIEENVDDAQLSNFGQPTSSKHDLISTFLYRIQFTGGLLALLRVCMTRHSELSDLADEIRTYFWRWVSPSAPAPFNPGESRTRTPLYDPPMFTRDISLEHYTIIHRFLVDVMTRVSPYEAADLIYRAASSGLADAHVKDLTLAAYAAVKPAIPGLPALNESRPPARVGNTPRDGPFDSVVRFYILPPGVDITFVAGLMALVLSGEDLARITNIETADNMVRDFLATTAFGRRRRVVPMNTFVQKYCSKFGRSRKYAVAKYRMALNLL